MSPAAARGERSFVGLALGAELGERVSRAVLPTLAGVSHRAPAAAGLHLTLAFLGTVPPATIAALSPSLARALAGVVRLRLRLAGTGVFPRSSRPKVFWVAVTEEEGAGGGLEEAWRAVQRALAEVGCSPADAKEPFRPHVTVARAKGIVRNAPEEFLKLELDLGWRPGAVELFASRTTPEGSHYEALARVPFADSE